VHSISKRWAVSWPTASDWVWDGTANPYRSYSSAEQLARNRAPPSGETKAGIVGCVGDDPALVPDAATVVGWAHQQYLAGVPKKYVFESSSSLAHLGNSPEG